MTTRKPSLTSCVLSLLIIGLAWPTSAFAVQGHSGIEGLVAHQIGHALFIFGISYLLYKIHHTHLEDPGWTEFKTFLWLLVSWNLLTFSGHWMHELVDQAKLSKVDGNIVAITINGPWDLFFYLTRLDHLLLLPAFFLLLLALRKWRRQP